MDKQTVILVCSGCRAKNRVPLTRIDDHPKCGKCQSGLEVQVLSRPVIVTDVTFDREVLSSSLPVLVDCWAPWCGPCRAIGPVMDELAVTFRGRVKIAKLNLDENPMIGSRYVISSVPTLLLVKNGKIIDKLIGALPKQQMEAAIARIL
ncbi:MAG: thioredoxin TrxC [Pseudomonadota bacterium]